MKTKIIFILILFCNAFLYSCPKGETSIPKVDFAVLKHYNAEEVSILLQNQDFTKQFIINLTQRKIMIYSDEEKKTLITMYDKNDNLLDSLAVMFMYHSANSSNMYSSQAFCLEGFSSDIPDMIYYLVYCNNDSEEFLLFPINRKDFWGMFADSNNIYYSLEFEKENIKRINISDNSLYSYPYSFPYGTDIFSYEEELYFNYGEGKNEIKKTYKLNETTITPNPVFIEDVPKKQIEFN